MAPEVGSTMQWQDGSDVRAPLVTSVLEQFGRMTALARETTTNLLTSTAYWGPQPGWLLSAQPLFLLFDAWYAWLSDCVAVCLSACL